MFLTFDDYRLKLWFHKVVNRLLSHYFKFCKLHLVITLSFLFFTTDVQNMSAVNAQPPKTTSALQTTLQNLAAAKKRSTLSLDSNNSSNDLGRSNHHHNTSTTVVAGGKDENWEGSLHSYHAWLKEKQKEEEEKKKSTVTTSPSNNNTNNKFSTTPPTTTTSTTTPSSSVKDEDEDEEDVINQDDSSYHVDAIMERGPSPPENNENSNSYEWSYEEQFKQVTKLYMIFISLLRVSDDIKIFFSQYSKNNNSSL